MCSTFHDIRKSFASLRVEKNHRHREIASLLNVTEVELLDSHVGVTKLESIKSFPNLARAIRLKPMLTQFMRIWPFINTHHPVMVLGWFYLKN